MNAAFLLVTSAMLVGQAGAKTPANPAPAAPAASSCCGQDSCGCDGFGHRLRDRLHGMFNRNSCDTCQTNTCCQNTHTRAPACKPACNDCCQKKTWTWQHKCRQPRQTCNSCGNDCCGNQGPGLLEKLRSCFHRNDCGCDGGCGSTTPVKSGETINAPKQMPKGGTKKGSEEVRFENQPVPFAPNANPVDRTVPSVEVTPVPAPRINGVSRQPF